MTEKKRKLDEVLRRFISWLKCFQKQARQEERGFFEGAYINVRDREKTQARRSIAPLYQLAEMLSKASKTRRARLF